MKLHLPCRLYRAVLSVMALAAVWTAPSHAAAISNSSNSTLTSLTQTSFVGLSSSRGAAIDNAGSIILEDAAETLEFLENVATGSSGLAGGAIYNSATFTLTGDTSIRPNITFSGNQVVGRTGSGMGYSGGAIYHTARNANVQALFSMESCGNIAFQGNSTTYYNGGAILNKGFGSSNIVVFQLNQNRSVSFSENTSAKQGGAIANENYCTFAIEGNNDVQFIGNKALSSSYGGAIHNSGAFSLSRNGNVSLTDNLSQDGSGGAVYNTSQGSFAMTGNNEVQFRGNQAQTSNSHGGAIDNSGAFTLEQTQTEALFSGNVADSCGGAIYNYSSTGICRLQENTGSITFSGNRASATNSLGGAIYNASSAVLTVENNQGGVFFRDNEAGTGGAISNMATLTLEGNSQVAFIGNKAHGEQTRTPAQYDVLYGGGAISNRYGAMSLSGNGSVLFEGNTAAAGVGGAIALSSVRSTTGVFTISSNETVKFQSNGSGGRGGAIYNNASVLNIANNDKVAFGGNYEVAGDGTYTLRSIYVEAGELHLAAAAGGSITFQDSLYADASSVVTFNQDFATEPEKTLAQTGDIIFTGAAVEQDLARILQTQGVDRAATEAELTASRTSTVGQATLYGGRLRIEQGAVYAGQRLEIEGGALRLQEGTVTLGGALSFASGATLALAETNTVTASSLSLAGGSSLSVEMSADQTSAAALALVGKMDVTSAGVSLNLTLGEGMEMKNGSYALLELQEGALCQEGTEVTDWEQWLAGNVVADVSALGTWGDYATLAWKGTTLYVDVDYAVTWSNTAGTRLWSADDLNFATKSGRAVAFTDGMGVLFTDEGAGEVILSGALSPDAVQVNNSKGHDYTWVAEPGASGFLAGDMRLEKSGEGTLAIHTENTYSGGTVIAGGTVAAGTASALGTGNATLTGGTLVVAADGFANQVVAGGETASRLEVAAGKTLALGQALEVEEGSSLELAGTFDASRLQLTHTEAGRIDTAGNRGAHGFAKAAEDCVTLATGSTIDSGAVITHSGLEAGETLALGTDGTASRGGVVDYSVYLLGETGTAISSAIHQAAEAAGMGGTDTVVKLQGGTLVADDATVVEATGGRIHLGGEGASLNGSVSGTTVVTSGGDINAVFSGENTLAGSHYSFTGSLNNEGVLTLTGSFNVAGLSPVTTPATFMDTAGQEGSSGFGCAAKREVTLSTGSGSLLSNGAYITDGEVTYTLQADGTATWGGGIDYSAYHLSGTDEASTSAIHGAHAESAHARVDMTGGTLTVDDSALVEATGGTIRMMEGGALQGSLTNTQVEARAGEINAAFTGENTLVGSDYALTGVLQNEGVLEFSGTFDASLLELTHTEATFLDTTGNSSSSGFWREEQHTVTLATGCTVDGGAVITHSGLGAGETLALGTDGTAASGGRVDYSVYHLSGTDEASTSAIHGCHAGSAHARVEMAGGTLTVNDAAHVEATGGIVSLVDGGQLEGSLSGSTAVTSKGEASLAGDNTYTGGTTVSGGILSLQSDTAAGAGEITLEGGQLDLNGHMVSNGIIVRGAGTLAGASSFAGNLTLAYGGQLSTEDDGCALGAGQTLSVESGSKGYVGALTLSGGRIILAEGASFTVAGTATFTQGTTTAIDVSAWGADTLTEGTELARFGSYEDYTAASLGLEGYQGEGALHFNRLTGVVTLLLHDPSAELGRNEKAAYNALSALGKQGQKWPGKLGEALDLVLSETSSGALSHLLERLNGASLALAMNSQVEGNLAHLRRLRQSIGSGDQLPTSTLGLAAYVNAYHDSHTLSADASGKGYRRTEWGAQLGLEKQLGRTATIGLAFSNGRANIAPTDDQRYHEEAQRLDLYAVANLGAGWQSITSIGCGWHRFDLRRQYVDGSTVSADGVGGMSFNLMQELNYTLNLRERHRLQPFLTVQMSANHLDSFAESGAGTASLHGESRHAWATDVTLGARYLYRFTAMAAAPAATLGLQVGVVTSVGDTTADLVLHFQGAEGENFSVSTANRNRWGGNLEATLNLPLKDDMALYAASGAILRGDSSEFTAQLGLRLAF